MISNLQLEGTSMFLYYLNSINKFCKFKLLSRKSCNFKKMRWSCKFKLQLNWVDPLGQNYNFKNIIICKPKIDLSFFKIEPIPSKVN